jgi:hypothetical protein
MSSAEDIHPAPAAQAASFRLSPAAVLYTTAVLLILHLVAMYLMLYDPKDWDDKAVHYYSAAYLFAGRDARHQIRDARRAWTEGISRSKARRLNGRLKSAHNYLLADVLIGTARACVTPATGSSPGLSFAFHVKAAFLTLLLGALLWLSWVTRARPLLSVLLLAGLSLTATASLDLLLLADRPLYNMRPLHYVPRASAAIVFMAVLVCGAQRRYRELTVSAVLLALWHFGFSLMVIPPVLVALLLARAFDSRLVETHLPLRTARWLWITALAGGALLALGWLIPSLSNWVRLLLPIAVVAFAQSLRSRDETAGALRLLVLAAGFYLAVSQLEILIVGNSAIGRWLMAATQNPLIAEIPDRLSATRYWAAILLVAGLVFVGLERLRDGLPRLPATAWKTTGTALAVAFAMLALWQAGWLYGWIGSRGVPFFTDEGRAVELVRVDPDTLTALNPRNEPVFFFSLAEYLFHKR